MNSWLIRTPFVVTVMLAVCFADCEVRSEVFVDYFQPTNPQQEPFGVVAGDSFKSVLVTDNSSIAVTGGSVLNLQEQFSRSAIRLLDNAQADIYGGQMGVHKRDGTSGTPVLYAQDNSLLNVSGGVFEGYGRSDFVVSLSRSSQVNINGGSFIGHSDDVMLVNGLDAVLNIRGGEFQTMRSTDVDLMLRAGTANIFVESATLDGNSIDFGSLTAGSGVLSVVFSDGETEEISFLRNTNAAVNIIAAVPEPSSTVVLLCGLLFALIPSRRRL